MDVGKGRKHDHMDVGGRTMSGTVVEERKLTPLRGVQDDSKDGGGRVVSGTTTEVERIRTNIGHIRVKMSGTNFPDRVEEYTNDDGI